MSKKIIFALVWIIGSILLFYWTSLPVLNWINSKVAERFENTHYVIYLTGYLYSLFVVNIFDFKNPSTLPEADTNLITDAKMFISLFVIWTIVVFVFTGPLAPTIYLFLLITEQPGIAMIFLASLVGTISFLLIFKKYRNLSIHKGISIIFSLIAVIVGLLFNIKKSMDMYTLEHGGPSWTTVLYILAICLSWQIMMSCFLWKRRKVARLEIINPTAPINKIV